MNQPTTMATSSSTPRAMRRPAGVKAPAHWQATTVPEPGTPVTEPDTAQPGGRNPVRYGDWEYKGLAIDF